MISVEEAISKVKSFKNKISTAEIAINNAVGYVLSEDIYATFDLPSFNQSAMDGYAIKGQHLSYKVIGEIKAGDTTSIDLKDQEAVRIFTGAKTPINCDAVIQQELVIIKENAIEIEDYVSLNKNIRLKGCELKKGDIILKKHTKISPATIGLLASFGFDKVKVFNRPKVAIIVTGNELLKLNEPLVPGKIYESNSHMLLAALNTENIVCKVETVKDDFESTIQTLQNAITNNDIVIVSGGISVGKYDFVQAALNELEVQQIFYKVKQKPGKPLYYGKINQKQVFALPGNPAAALSCFYMYVLIAIQKQSGQTNQLGLNTIKAKLSHNFELKGNRAQFLKSFYQNNQVTVLNKQSSAMLSSFSEANALVFIPDSTSTLPKGSDVLTYLLPQ